MKKILPFIFPLIVLSCVLSTHICYANPLPLPSIIISVQNAPEDLEIILLPDNLIAKRFDKSFQSYFIFNGYEIPEYRSIKVTTENKVFELNLDLGAHFSDRFFVLDLERQSITPGKSALNVIKPITAVVLTLVIEGFVFFLFGYRKKTSWLVFLIVNLLTQGFLNIWLTQFDNPLIWGNYPLSKYLFGEFWVFVAETVIFLIFVKEHCRLRTALYVIAANLLSLIIGWYLFTLLPI